MRIEIGADGEFQLFEVFNGIGIVTDAGHFGICERDGGIEILRNGKQVWSCYPGEGEDGPDTVHHEPQEPQMDQERLRRVEAGLLSVVESVNQQAAALRKLPDHMADVLKVSLEHGQELEQERQDRMDAREDRRAAREEAKARAKLDDQIRDTVAIEVAKATGYQIATDPEISVVAVARRAYALGDAMVRARRVDFAEPASDDG